MVGVAVYEISPVGLGDSIERDKYYTATRDSSMPQPVCYTVEHADSSKLYLGGVVGYNAGTIQGATYKAGMIINRRSNNNTPNLTAVGGIAGYNKGTIINEKYNSYVRNNK